MTGNRFSSTKARQTITPVLAKGRRGALLALILAGFLVLSLGPERAWGHVTDVMPDAVAEMEYRILLDFQPEKIEVRNKLAMVLYRKKKFKEAEEELRAVLAAEPANFNALDGLGLVMAQTGRPQEALEQHLAAIAANPKDVLVHYHLGQVYMALGNFPAADKALSQALELANQPSATATQAADLAAIRQALEENRQKLGQAPPPQK